MFSGIFSSISWYIILGLASLLSASGYLNYQYIGEIAVAKQSIKDQAKVAEGYENSLNLARQSCNTDTQSVVELTAEQTEVRDKIDTLVVKISNLKSGIAIAPETEASKNAKESNVLYGPELLSLDLRLLLDKAYCLAEPTASICGTTIQPSSVPVQSFPVR